MSLRRIGILGGMGPEATLLLMRKLLAAVPATDDADHVPLIVDQNPQVPSRIDHLIAGTGADPAPVLADMAARLERAGAAALAMPCNTAHHYAGAIRDAVRIPFLDMVRLSADRAAAGARGTGQVGILGSPALRRTGLFEAPLAERGLSAIYPADEDATLAAVREIKSAGPTPGARLGVAEAARALVEAGAETILVACTEFSLVADAASAGAAGTGSTVFDTLDVLVDAILDAARGGASGAGPRAIG